MAFTFTVIRCRTCQPTTTRRKHHLHFNSVVPHSFPSHAGQRPLEHSLLSHLQKLNVCTGPPAFLLSFLALVSFKQKKRAWVIRNPHTLLIDDGQLAKNAKHKTQKSDWTGDTRGREGAWQKIRERRATSFAWTAIAFMTLDEIWKFVRLVQLPGVSCRRSCFSQAAVRSILYKNVFVDRRNLIRCDAF